MVCSQWGSNLFAQLQFTITIIVSLITARAPVVPCNCAIQSANTSNQTAAPNQLISCSRDPIPVTTAQHVSCHRMDKFVRIGPIETVPQRINSEEAELTSSDIQSASIGIAPWAFAELALDNGMEQLQLDLSLKDQSINALTVSGLVGLKKLLARTSQLRWDECALADLANLQEAVLNCRSDFGNFLTFGPTLKLVRFVDCQDVARQFFCVQCRQDPSVNVVRIRPGPPLRQHVVKIRAIDVEAGTNGVNHESGVNHLSFGQCVPDVCSDLMMCRDNDILKEARIQRRSKMEQSATTTSSTTTTTTKSPVRNVSAVYPVSVQTEVSRRASVPNSNQRLSPTIPTSLLQHRLTQIQRFWIVGSILALIAFFLLASSILIVFTHRHSRPILRKRSREVLRATTTANGLPEEASPTLTAETKLEALDIA